MAKKLPLLRDPQRGNKPCGVEPLYHMVDGIKVPGPNPLMFGAVHGVGGNCTKLRGNFNGIVGDLDEIPMDCRDHEPDVAFWTQSEADSAIELRRRATQQVLAAAA